MSPNREMEILRTDIKDVILYSYKLHKYFNFGDLLGYKKILEKDKKLIQKVTQELFKLGALATEIVPKTSSGETEENNLEGDEDSSQGTLTTKSKLSNSETSRFSSINNWKGGDGTPNDNLEFEKRNILTDKGNFIIHISLKTMNAALLYECMRLNIPELGLIASSTLKKARGFFRKNVSYLLLEFIELPFLGITNLN